MDRALRGQVRAITTRAAGRFRLGALPRGARVELTARLAIPGGRFLCVDVNGHEVRLVRPDRAAPLDHAAPYYAAVDPAFLREGLNSVVITVPPMPPAFETAFGLSDVHVDPPGLALRVGGQEDTLYPDLAAMIRGLHADGVRFLAYINTSLVA